MSEATPRTPEFASVVRRAEIEGPDTGTLEGRAALGLKLLAVLNTAGLVLALFPGITPEATLYRVIVSLAGGGLGVVYAIEAIGLGRRRDWANAALRPLLVLLAVAGVYGLVVGLPAGRFRIPFETLVAVWAFLGPRDMPTTPRLEARSIALLGGAIAIAAVQQFSAQLFGWGGVFDVHAQDLRPVVSASCATPSGGPGGAPPERLTLSYDWSWTRGTGLPSGTDLIVLGWKGADAQGRPLYVLDGIPQEADGVYPGRAGGISTDMADAVAKELKGSSYRWAVVLEEQQLRAGSVDLALRLARPDSESPEPLSVTATYIHAGLWRNDAPAVTCAW